MGECCVKVDWKDGNWGVGDCYSRGFGYVTLDAAAASKCLTEKQIIDGRTIDVKVAVPPYWKSNSSWKNHYWKSNSSWESDSSWNSGSHWFNEGHVQHMSWTFNEPENAVYRDSV